MFDDFENSFEKLGQLKEENEYELSKISDNLNKSFKPVTNKQKLLVGEIKNNVDIFIKEFNKYFFDTYFENVLHKTQSLLEEKNKKKENVNLSYNQQIADMESLLNQGKNCSKLFYFY